MMNRERTTSLEVLRRLDEYAAPAMRFVVGTTIAALGVRFVQDVQGVTQFIPGQSVYPLAAFALAHAIVITHIGGGMLMAIGFLTRWAALAQLPIFVAVLALVPSSASVAVAPAYALPLCVMVLFVVVFGSGRYGADRWLDAQPSFEPAARIAVAPARK